MTEIAQQPSFRQSEVALAQRHGHRQAYAAIVLAGSYCEAGSLGRLTVRPGEALIHPTYDRHLNTSASQRLDILNIALPDTQEISLFGRVEDPDALARLADCDVGEARRHLFANLRPFEPPTPGDWPDLLRAAIEADPTLALRDWAHQQGLSPSTLGRGFAACYGVTPSRFRLEAKNRRALKALTDSARTLGQIAADSGFSDQAHMTRAIYAYTGTTPRMQRLRLQLSR